MFDRKYAARDRYKSKPTNRTIYYRARGSVASLNAFKLYRSAPVEDVGIDGEMFCFIEEKRAEFAERHILETLTPEQWRRYTTPVPFCTVPEGGAKPSRKGVKKMTRNPFRKPTERAAEVNLIKAFAADVKQAKATDELPPEPTFAEQLAKAGGRILTVPNATEVADWHEQDPTL